MPDQHPDQQNIKRNDFLTDVVIGLSDGLTIPFALAVGLSGVVTGNYTIIVAGLTATVAGAIAMALGGYLAGRPQVDHFHPTEGGKDSTNKGVADKQKEGVKHFFANLGLTEELQERATAEITEDRKQWDDFVRKYELELDQPDAARAAKRAFNIGISYAIGGLVPILPYLLTDAPGTGRKFSIILTLSCLFIFGFLRGRFTAQNPWKDAARATIIGALAALAAYYMMSLFQA